MRALDLARRAVIALEKREHAEGEARLDLTLEALALFALAGSELQPPATEQATTPMPRFATGGYVPTSERTSEIPTALNWCPNGGTQPMPPLG